MVRSVDFSGRDLTPVVCGSQYRVAPIMESQPVTTATLPPDEAAAPALLDVRAVAQLLDCSTRHVYRLADAGRMPAPVRLGSLVRWRRADLDAWLAGGCKPCRTAGRG